MESRMQDYMCFISDLLLLDYNLFHPLRCCYSLSRCANDNIHKDFRKAIGANCIFYSAQTHELIVLVSFLRTHEHIMILLLYYYYYY